MVITFDASAFLGKLSNVLLRYFCGSTFHFQISLLRYVLIHYLLLLDAFVNVCSFQCYLTVFDILLHTT